MDGIYVTDKSLICLVNASGKLILYAAFLLLFIRMFLQAKNVTLD
jgi:hypothetical protein